MLTIALLYDDYPALAAAATFHDDNDENRNFTQKFVVVVQNRAHFAATLCQLLAEF